MTDRLKEIEARHKEAALEMEEWAETDRGMAAHQDRASKVTIDDAAVERALDEYEQGIITYWRNNPTDEPTADLVANFKTRMRAALEAAFPASTSEWSAAIEAAAKVARGFANCGCGRSDCYSDNIPRAIETAIRALSRPTS